MKEQLIQEIKNVINEATKVNYKGHTFILKIDVNEDPYKKGIKVQFLPTTTRGMSPQEQNDIAMALGTKLESGLQAIGMSVDRDRELKDKSVIGFFIGIEHIDKIMRQALQSN
jgi:hypothetical protein